MARGRAIFLSSSQSLFENWPSKNTVNVKTYFCGPVQNNASTKIYSSLTTLDVMRSYIRLNSFKISDYGNISLVYFLGTVFRLRQAKRLMMHRYHQVILTFTVYSLESLTACADKSAISLGTHARVSARIRMTVVLFYKVKKSCS